MKTRVKKGYYAGETGEVLPESFLFGTRVKVELPLVPCVVMPAGASNDWFIQKWFWIWNLEKV